MLHTYRAEPVGHPFPATAGQGLQALAALHSTPYVASALCSGAPWSGGVTLASPFISLCPLGRSPWYFVIGPTIVPKAHLCSKQWSLGLLQGTHVWRRQGI